MATGCRWVHSEAFGFDFVKDTTGQRDIMGNIMKIFHIHCCLSFAILFSMTSLAVHSGEQLRQDVKSFVGASYAKISVVRDDRIADDQ